MSDTAVAKIFMHGRSQAVRLPLAFRLPGDRVRVDRDGQKDVMRFERVPAKQPAAAARI